MRLILVIFIFFLCGSSVLSRTIRIGVYNNYSIQSIRFSYEQGSYKIIGDASVIGYLQSNESVTLTRKGNKVEIKKGVINLGIYKKIRLVPSKSNFYIQLHPTQPRIKSRKYNDGFELFVNDNALAIVNCVKMNNYLSGVVESEGGGGKPIEYYKAQAVISRTFALKYWDRHKSEGFNLCDRVHCQAYYNKLKYTETIRFAVEATRGVYAVDTLNNELVHGFFHSNCGGQTTWSDYVWRVRIPYLKPVKDTFCIYSSNAHWEKKISKDKWEKYLANEYFYPFEDSVFRNQLFTFEQKERKAFYLTPALGIPLRNIRRKFRLKSTFFSCHPDGDYVILTGRGFGHGVGLCQQGAMNMAEQGYTYREILQFYFSGIELENRFYFLFFNQDDSLMINNYN